MPKFFHVTFESARSKEVVSQSGWLKYNYGLRRHKLIVTSSPMYHTASDFLKRIFGK